MKLEYYRDNLAHVVRPDKISERPEADRVTLEDYEALWLREELKNIAHGSREEERGIAQAYIEYIDMAVRKEQKDVVHLYMHTLEAKLTLERAAMGPKFDIASAVHEAIQTAVVEANDSEEGSDTGETRHS